MYLPSEQFPHQNSKTKNISLVVIWFVLYDLQYNIGDFVRTINGQNCVLESLVHCCCKF
jgi:hypothetical protein